MSRGTLPLKVRIRGCDPIRVLSGTHDPKVLKKLKNMIHALHEQGRDDLVNAIAKGPKRGGLTVLQVYNHWKFSRLDQLPHAEELPRFADAYERWLREAEIGDDWALACEGYFRRLLALMPKDASLSAIPAALAEYRVLNRDKGVSFHRCRTAVQAFLRDTLTRRHRLWLDVTAIPAIKGVRPKRAKHPLTPDGLHRVVKELGEPYGSMAWTMALTGMGFREYEGEWHREGDGVRIHGTKTHGRNRLVPYVSLLYPPGCKVWPYRRRLKAQGLTPYDMRRTYTSLMIEAGVPRPRRKLYLGHSPEDITALYEFQEVRDYLLRDAERMRSVLGEPEGGPTLALVAK